MAMRRLITTSLLVLALFLGTACAAAHTPQLQVENYRHPREGFLVEFEGPYVMSIRTDQFPVFQSLDDFLAMKLAELSTMAGTPTTGAEMKNHLLLLPVPSMPHCQARTPNWIAAVQYSYDGVSFCIDDSTEEVQVGEIGNTATYLYGDGRVWVGPDDGHQQKRTIRLTGANVPFPDLDVQVFHLGSRVSG